MLDKKNLKGRLAITLALAVMALTFAVPRAGATVLWDNDIVPDGVNGRALSPPDFTDVRAVDDFTVGAGGWIIQDFHANVIEDASWTSGTDIELYIYNDSAGSPGSLFTSVVTASWSKVSNGFQIFGRDDYDYWIEGLSIAIDPGTYWIGFRNPDGSGSGTNYWMTSTGGPDGSSSSTGFFSLDAAATWNPEGDGWQHAFQLTGVHTPKPASIPEPASLALFGFGLLGLGVMKRRRRAA